MNKTYGVCAGLLILGLVGIGAPASHARNLPTGETAGASETPAATSTTSTTSAASEASAADLRQRIEALKAQLADLNTELAATTTDAPAPSATQDAAAQAPASAPAAAAPAAPMPLSTPSMAGPMATGIPHELPAGPFGKIEVTGILSGFAQFSDKPFVTGDEGHVDLSNAQIFIQKTSGVVQFYLQGGAYNLPAIGYPFLKTSDTTRLDYGPFPVGYLKLVKGNFNVEIGSLPTLIGDEYTFTFQNMNIERGLLWSQEPAISRGVQINDTYKKLTVSFSWNDGFYSDRYTSLSGLATWAFNAANTLTFAAGGNAGTYARVGPASFPTPFFQNNETVYNLIYTYTKGPVTISPYYQYTKVASGPILGVGAHTNGGAILANYNFKHGFSLSARPEYIKSSGSVATGEANLLLSGSGTGAFSFTVTPTWSKDAFFVRGDISVVHLTNFTAGSPGFTGFGIDGLGTNQARGVIETGFMF